MPVQIDVAPIMDRVTAGLKWLERKQMYIWKTEYTIQKLKKARDELKFTIQDVMESIADARRNGWSPKHRAEGWVLLGFEIIEHANGTVAKFDEQLALLLDPDSIGIVHILFHCPCDALSRRVLNAEAVTRLIDIKEHRDEGEKIYLAGGFDAVASKRDDQAVATVHLQQVPHLKTPLLSTKPSFNEQHKALMASGVDIDKLKLGALAQYRAFARSQSCDNMPVMIRIRAPRYARWSRAPIDVVMLLDISSLGADNLRLEQVKKGAMFVVHNLEEEDRLSILQPFHKRTHTLFPLTHMSDQQKKMAKTKIAQLFLLHGSTTDIVAAMGTAYQILEDGQEDNNRVGSIMLLTDSLFDQNRKTVDDRNVTRQLISSTGHYYPTYTLGIGSDHDACTMYEIATGGHGTYSFVDERDSKSIKDAMALCMGGLTSIVAQRVSISISTAQKDVKIARIASGAYHQVVDEGKTSASITIDDLYGNEEKSFLVYVKVPPAQGASMLRRTTRLLTVKANYHCHVTKADVKTDPVEVSIKRPIKVRGQPSRNIFVQVMSEVMRARVLERVKDIWSHVETTMIIDSDELKSIQDFVGDTEEAKEAKDKWDDISMDLDDMQDTDTGFPYMLSWLSSHQWQRAATTPGSSSTTSFSFRTTRMNNMVDSVESAPL